MSEHAKYSSKDGGSAVWPADQRASRRLILETMLGLLFAGGLTIKASAQEEGHGGGKGGKGGSGGESGHSGGEGGHSGGEGEGGGGKGGGEGKTSRERAQNHYRKRGSTLGGGEHGDGGHKPPTGTSTTGSAIIPDDAGTIGGSGGGEHFIHSNPGGWGVDSKSLRP